MVPSPAPDGGREVARDTDADGVPDAADRCADTPQGDRVDANGCSLPEDGDGDGVTDDRDRCADTPAGEQVDPNGCQLPKDDDGDGVTNDQDTCPGTRAGTQVDATGCQVLFEETRTSLVLEGVTFATGKAELTEDSRSVLRTVAQSLVAHDSIRVEVQGHTDNTGSLAVNRRLSQARAEAVKDFLMANGVAAERLVAKGYGPDQPAESNATAEGRARNRRVELKRLP